MDNQSIPDPQKRPEYWSKLDIVMRRLLEMDDEAVRRHIQQDAGRLSRLQEGLLKEVLVLPKEELFRQLEHYQKRTPTPAPGDLQPLRAELLQLRAHELLTDDLVAIILPGRLPQVYASAITTFTGNRADLQALGLEVQSQSQDIFTVVGTPRQLRDLASQPACRELRAPRRLYPVVEDASAQAEVAAVHIARPPVNPNGYQGNGILLGIIDSALDVTHHTFRDPAGTNGTRLLYYWVQVPYDTFTPGGEPDPLTGAPLANLPGDNPEDWAASGAANTRPDFSGKNYGRLYTQADINTAINAAANAHYGTAAGQICCRPRAAEHGTHCAGIAAGNGRQANAAASTHIGAAPQATIIYVCYNGNESGILDAIDFIFHAAAFHTMPAVISVSQAHNFSGRTGDSAFDHGIDGHLNSFFNRSVVVAAGNSDDESAHQSAVIPANGSANFTLTNNSNNAAYLEIWYSGPELDYQVSYGGANSGRRTAGQGYNGSVSGRTISAGRDVSVNGGLRNICIFFSNAVNADVFTIQLWNPNANQSAEFNAWSNDQWLTTLNPAVAHSATLAGTASSQSVLSVGAASKVNPPNPATGEQVTGYSGAGFTLDGRIKPEIMAVGEGITSAASNQADGWTVMGGTSMATPLVAGAVAQLLEAYNGAPSPMQLNQDTIKALLTQHANRTALNLDPNQAGYQAEQQRRYGYGRLRMIDAIDQSQPTPNVDVWIRTAGDDWGLRPYLGECFCGAPDIRVCQVGTDTEVTDIHWNTAYDVKVTVHDMGSTNALVTTVRLKYTLPWAAPSDWKNANDAAGQALTRNVDIPAMNQRQEIFQWTPKQADIPNAPAGQTHFCLLVELDQQFDPLVYWNAAAAGGDAWSRNIRGTNNVALHNLDIQ
jgi:subtilisin family serine protease